MKNKNLLRRLFIAFSAIMLTFFLGCRDDAPNDNPTPEPPKEEIVLKEKPVTVELPAEVGNKVYEKLTVSNAFGDYKLSQKPTPSAKSSRSSNSADNSSLFYGVEINYTVDGLILTNVLDPQGGVMMCSIDNPERDPVVKINAEKTAIAILMQHPALITSDKDEFNLVVDYIKKLPEFDNYKREVYREMIKGIKNGYTPDYASLANYRPVIIALLNKTKDNSFLTPSQIRINQPIKKENGKFEFTITNEHKRVLHMYPKKVKVASNGLTVISSEYIKDDDSGYLRVLEPKGADYWKIVGDGLKGDKSSPFEATSDPIKVDIGDADKLYYEVYGIGKLTKPFSEYTKDEQYRIIFVGLHGAYKDFIKPFIELVFQVKKVSDASGTDSYNYDFRRGSKKAPLRELLTGLTEDFVKDKKQMTQVGLHLSEKEYLAIAQQFAEFSVDQILGNKQSPEKKRRYLNNLYDIFKDVVGVSKTTDSFRDVIKKLANQISHAKNANFAGKVIKLSELAVDVSGAVYAYYNTEAVHTFIIDKSDEPYVTLKAPEARKTFVKKGVVTFSWDFYRAGLLGEIKYDLIINAIRVDGVTKEVKFTDIKDKKYTIDFTKQFAGEGFYNFKWKVIAKRGANTVKSDEYSISFLPEFLIVKNKVSIEAGKTHAVQIALGSGSYTINSSNPNVAVAEVKGNLINITAKAEGTAVIGITDNKANQTRDINVTVTPSKVQVTLQDKIHYIASLHVGNTTVQGKITNGLQIKIPYSNGQGSYGAVTAQQTTASGQGGDTKTLRLEIPAGNFNGDGELTATLSVSGNGTYLVRQMPAGKDYTIATFSLNIGGKPISVTLKGIGGILDRFYNIKTNGEYEHRFVYIPITGPDGKTWLNNNLGADYANENSPHFNPAQQAKSKDDHHAYGSLYQWGREGDGHELMNWTSSKKGTPKHDKGWKNYKELKNYHEPCPEGYHTPTLEEWEDLHEAITGSRKNISSGKMWKERNPNLPASGRRLYTGEVANIGQGGKYWTSNRYYYGPINSAHHFNFNDTHSVIEGSSNREEGHGIRCLKD